MFLDIFFRYDRLRNCNTRTQGIKGIDLRKELLETHLEATLSLAVAGADGRFLALRRSKMYVLPENSVSFQSSYIHTFSSMSTPMSVTLLSVNDLQMTPNLEQLGNAILMFVRLAMNISRRRTICEW